MRRAVFQLLCFLALLAPYAVHSAAADRGALVVTPADTQKPVTLYSRSYALVIGIDAYANGWPRLSNAVNDARAVAVELETRGFDVTLATNLTSEGMKAAVEDLVYQHGLDPEARLFIWFAGHSHTINGEAYLVPADAPGPEAEFRLRPKAFSMRDLRSFMIEVRAKHVLAVFDSGLSTNVFRTDRSRMMPKITHATTFPVRQMLSSGQANQTVSDDGVFRRLFLDALTGKEPHADANKDGYLTGSELGHFLSNKITHLTSGQQVPHYGKLRSFGLDRGDFVLRVGRTRELDPRTRAARVLTPDEDGGLSPTYSKSYALLIGVSDYKNDKHWYDLDGAKADIDAIAKVLQQRHGFEVTKVFDPSKAELEQAFDDFIYGHGQEEDARLLIYFAGHGYTTRNGPLKVGWLVPSDATSPHENGAKFKRGAINMQRVHVYSMNISSKHVLWVFDSCFGGTIFDKFRSPAKPQRWEAYLKKRKVRRIITSGSADQRVPDKSVFAELFVQALKGERQIGDTDGLITGSELAHFLRASVIGIKGKDQTPQEATVKLFGANEGDIVFQVPN